MAAFTCQRCHMLSAKMLSRIYAGHRQKPLHDVVQWLIPSWCTVVQGIRGILGQMCDQFASQLMKVPLQRLGMQEAPSHDGCGRLLPHLFWYFCITCAIKQPNFGLRVLYGFLFQRLKVRWKLDSKVQYFDSCSFDMRTELPRSWWYFHIRTQERSCLRRMSSVHSDQSQTICDRAATEQGHEKHDSQLNDERFSHLRSPRCLWRHGCCWSYVEQIAHKTHGKSMEMCFEAISKTEKNASPFDMWMDHWPLDPLLQGSRKRVQQGATKEVQKVPLGCALWSYSVRLPQYRDGTSLRSK